jgi:polyisoprenoid-binding protein YceI
MKKIALFGFTAALLLGLSPVRADETYKIDPMHTTLTFSVRHMAISNVKGHFDEFAGSIVMDHGVIKEATGTIQVKSINTGIEKRDNHLRSPDFFDATKYPEITFKTKRVVQSGGETFLIADFTIHGVTRELRLPVTVSGPAKDPGGNIRIGLEARTKISRKDYGISFKGVLDSGVPIVGDEITLEINAEAVKETAMAMDKK